MTASQLPDAIAACVNAYYRLPKDGVDVVSLLDLQRRLAGLKYAFAVEVGRMYAERNAAEFARKAEFSRRRHDLVSGGATVAKAESEAQAAILPLLETEQKADAAHKAGNLILESSADVLRAMSQHIATLRQERRHEMAGMGSQ